MVSIKKPHYDFYPESSIMGEWKPLISLVARHNWMTSSNFSFPMALTRESLNITFCSAHFTKSCFKFQSIQDHAHLNHHAWREWNPWLVFFPFIFSILFWNNLWFYLFFCVFTWKSNYNATMKYLYENLIWQKYLIPKFMILIYKTLTNLYTGHTNASGQTMLGIFRNPIPS